MTAPRHNDQLQDVTCQLLFRAGIDCPTPPTLEPLTGGANNRVFRVALPGRVYLLKQYFAHPADDRDRFGAETAFTGLLWRHNIRSIPELLGTDSDQRLALFRFIEGRAIEPSEVDATLVDQAARFCRQLHGIQDTPEARRLPNAAESCFSLTAHLDCVARRLERLRSISPDNQIHRDVIRLVEAEVWPKWKAIHRSITEQAADDALDEELPPQDRVLSPSDFGFHNVLLTAPGNLCFFDFEYAGWDDPAKLVCDFFCQVKVPVPREFLPRFTAAVAPADTAATLLRRVECLLPVYRLKWCAILLNEFLPVGGARRRFSAAEPADTQHKKTQLDKARQMLRHIENFS